MPQQGKNSTPKKKGLARKAIDAVKDTIVKRREKKKTVARNAEQKVALSYASGNATAADVIAKPKTKLEKKKKTN